MRAYWVWLAQMTGVSAQRKIALLREYVNAKELHDAGKHAILTLENTTLRERDAFEYRNLDKAKKIVEECDEKGIGILPITSKLYPEQLRKIPDPPIILYFKGQIPRWDTLPAIGIVGTRKGSLYGMQCAFEMGKQISACGGLVVSGGALGVDAQAMEGALRHGYPTVGILGSGLSTLYPTVNRPLYDATVRNGCLLSEYAPDEPAYPGNLSRRNRLISGISHGVLVVEAPEKSGALITARYAKEQGKPLFVVPGNLDNPACAGSNALLREDAKVALSGYDVVGEFKYLFPERVRDALVDQLKPGPLTKEADKKGIDKPQKAQYSTKEPQPELKGDEKIVYDLLTEEPVPVDIIIMKSGIGASRVLVAITMLTIAKRIKNHPGKYISKL